MTKDEEILDALLASIWEARQPATGEVALESGDEHRRADPKRSRLHSHTCQECGRLRTCTQEPCPARGRDHETNWICSECQAAEPPKESTTLPLHWMADAAESVFAEKGTL
jgi:hypothetical protein